MKPLISGSLENPLGRIGIKVLWFHRRLFLAHRGHWERREIVCYLFVSDVTSELSFNGSNVTVTLLVWFGFLYPLLGKMPQMWGPWKFFCWEEANPRLCWRRNGGRWEMRRVVSASPCFQSSAAETLGNTQGNSRFLVTWSPSLMLILRLQSVFLERVWRVCVSRSCCSVQLKSYWELLGQVHDYNDSSMCLQLCFVKDKCPGKLVIH